MSFVAMIRRPAAPITYAEFERVLQRDDEFQAVGSPDSAMPSFLWKPSAAAPRPAVFHFWDPDIAVETPSNEALRKMGEVAAALGATVYGEEGEPMEPRAAP